MLLSKEYKNGNDFDFVIARLVENEEFAVLGINSGGAKT
jgi:hypothetical protein